MFEDELMTHNEIYSCKDNIIGINEYRNESYNKKDCSMLHLCKRPKIKCLAMLYSLLNPSANISNALRPSVHK